MIDESIVSYTFNAPQAKAAIVMANEMYAFMGRGTGKTTGVITPWLLHKVEAMARSTGALACKTFQDGEEKILKPIFDSLQEMGHVQGEQFVYATRPPVSWVKPYAPVINYDHVLSFPNGTNCELLSLHNRGSANGKSCQWLLADEAKFLDEKQLRGEIFPILRGNVRHFGQSPWYGAKLFVTDKYSPNIHWLLEKRKLVDHNLVKTVIHYQLKLNEIRLQLTEVPEHQTGEVWRQIKRLEQILAVLRKNLVCVIEGSARDNFHNLGQAFFDNMKRSLTEYEYQVAIENADPTRVENNFYPDRSAEHLHNNDEDDDQESPLGVVLDYQASISPLVSFQVNDRILGIDSLNFLSSPYVKAPLGLKDVVNDFCGYHKHRLTKEVYYFYDHTAVGKRNGLPTYAEEVVQHFEDNGWIVYPYYMGEAPLQSDKYRIIKLILQNKRDTYQVRMHQDRCAAMILSMDQAGTKETETGTKKDKSSERSLTVPQEQATHFSDCFDMAVWAVCVMDLYPRGSGGSAAGGVFIRSGN